MVWNIHFLFDSEIERALIPYQQVIKFQMPRWPSRAAYRLEKNQRSDVHSRTWDLGLTEEGAPVREHLRLDVGESCRRADHVASLIL